MPKEITVGSFTALNTDRYLYYSFYARIEELIRFRWESAVRQAMFGSNTLKLIDRNLYPVMIVPPDSIYTGINYVAFASDFKNVEATTPAPLIISVLEMWTKPVLPTPHLHLSLTHATMRRCTQNDRPRCIKCNNKFQ